MGDDGTTVDGTRDTLDRIFDPHSIVIVGASADPAKRGFQILRALAESRYRGDVFAVNPRGGSILGRRVYASIDAIRIPLDLAVLCTPAAAAPDLVRACGAAGIAGAVVLAVGFGESGPEGKELEGRLRDAGREAGVRIIGPNTSGLLNLSQGVNLVGAKGVRPGGLAFVVQSGNVALALMNEVTERTRDGVSIYLGVGNELDVGFGEALDYLGRHEDTRAIIVYVEGLRDARAFLEAAARITRKKPIIAIKSARTREGASAAESHTGTVAGPYDRLRAAMAQAGIVELQRTDELLHVAQTLGNQPPGSPGTGIAILSDGGGQGTLAADTLIESGASLANLSDDTRSGLRALLGTAAAVGNPVDVAGAADTDPETFARALDVIASDPAVGSVLLVGLFGGYGVRFAESLTQGELTAARAMTETMRGLSKGFVVHSMYASHVTEPLQMLEDARVPVIGSLEIACRCVAELQRRGARLLEPVWAPARLSAPDAGGPEVVRLARGGGRRTLTEPEARALLVEHGLTFGPGRIADSAEEAAGVAGDFAVPVAVKLVSEEITHKSDAGGVVLGVRSADDARVAFETVTANARAFAHQRGLPASPPRVLITPMLAPARAELLVGAYRDSQLGPMLTVGAGGLWVEALRDVAHRMLPVTDADIDAMIGELMLSRLLASGRGRAGVSRSGIVATARAVAACITSCADIAEIEVNPLFVYEDRCVPVDARVILTVR